MLAGGWFLEWHLVVSNDIAFSKVAECERLSGLNHIWLRRMLLGLSNDGLALKLINQ